MEQRFVTERTRFWRAQELDERDTQMIACIEEHCCEVKHVGKVEGNGKTGFSYTCGVFDTTGMPEILVVGLTTQTAHYLLNEAARRHQEGIDLTAAPQQNMIGNVLCIFRPVDGKWTEHLMRFDSWYYNSSDFPALQAIYPDRNGRFQWEDDDDGKEPFQEYFRQPLLQTDAMETSAEKDFWAENDPSSSLFSWPFPDPPHTRVFLGQSIQAGEEEITYVAHELDGDWQMLGDSMSGGLPPAVSCFHHPIDTDPTLKELADLPMGWWAERAAKGEPWVRRTLEEDE